MAISSLSVSVLDLTKLFITMQMGKRSWFNAINSDSHHTKKVQISHKSKLNRGLEWIEGWNIFSTIILVLNILGAYLNFLASQIAFYNKIKKYNE